MKRKKRYLLKLFLPLMAVLVLLWFFGSISGVSRGYVQEDQQRLEEALRRAAVSCYATEGFYPPSLEYLLTHYGVQIDQRHFAVSYLPIAENLMPQITVLEK